MTETCAASGEGSDDATVDGGGSCGAKTVKEGKNGVADARSLETFFEEEVSSSSAFVSGSTSSFFTTDADAAADAVVAEMLPLFRVENLWAWLLIISIADLRSFSLCEFSQKANRASRVLNAPSTRIFPAISIGSGSTIFGTGGDSVWSFEIEEGGAFCLTELLGEAGEDTGGL